jgi:hypothetical protein
MPSNILILGASYGSLLASKLLLAGHNVTLVCQPPEAELINREGFRVHLPIQRSEIVIEIDSRTLPGKANAASPAEVDPSHYDLVVLAMQEPQYRSTTIRGLIDAIAKSRVPCLSIMNMPPLAYLKRIPGLNYDALRIAYTDSSVWDGFDPGAITLCSADAQAVRPQGEKMNVLEVTLATNFKAAKFDSPSFTGLLRQLQQDIEALRWESASGGIDLPVKLKVHDSVFVPLAKWPMLLTGNYRCVTPEGMQTIEEAVHTDLRESRSLYSFVCDLCLSFGAAEQDLVTFDKYAAAAKNLSRPSSAARALNNGAPYIERADKLVQLIGRQKGVEHPLIDTIVELVDFRLEANRRKAA